MYVSLSTLEVQWEVSVIINKYNYKVRSANDSKKREKQGKRDKSEEIHCFKFIRGMLLHTCRLPFIWEWGKHRELKDKRVVVLEMFWGGGKKRVAAFNPVPKSSTMAIGHLHESSAHMH